MPLRPNHLSILPSVRSLRSAISFGSAAKPLHRNATHPSELAVEVSRGRLRGSNAHHDPQSDENRPTFCSPRSADQTLARCARFGVGESSERPAHL